MGSNLLLRNQLTLGNFDGLHNLGQVKGDVSLIFNRRLSSFHGLHGLNRVDSTLIVDSRDSLRSLAHLDDITHIAGDLRITDNASIETLDGPDSLAGVERAIHISGNANLTDIDALAELRASGTTAPAAIIVEGNPQLPTSAVWEFTLRQVEAGFTGTVIVARNAP